MFQHLQLRITEAVHDPKVRMAFILGTVLLAALATAAPSDPGGW